MGDLRKSNLSGVGSGVGFVLVVLVLVVVGVIVWKYSVPKNTASVSTQSMTGNKDTMLPPEKVVRVTPALAHAESTLELTPEKSLVTQGERFTLEATVDPGSNRVSGAELHVNFDPKAVKLEGIQASPTFSLELQAAKIDNSSGVASIALGTSLSESSITTKKTVATFSFLVLESSGASRIEITDKSLVSADNEAQNVLKAIKSAQVMIGSGK